MARKQRSLGWFKDHDQYSFEKHRGASSGFMAAFITRLWDWSIMFDIGGENDNKNKTQREFVEHTLAWHRGQILEELLEPDIKRPRKKHLRCQLIGLRLTRQRYYEMIERGVKERERQAAEANKEANAV
ncbi:hypothetical protein D3C71_1380310 [compost metagenome]